jgi:hypothetical protein
MVLAHAADPAVGREPFLDAVAEILVGLVLDRAPEVAPVVDDVPGYRPDVHLLRVVAVDDLVERRVRVTLCWRA